MNKDNYLEILNKTDVFHNSFVDVFFDLYDNYLADLESVENIFQISEKILNDEIFQKSLTLMIIPDLSWEKVFTKIRKEVCLKSVNGYKFSKNFLSFIESLSIQCFLTDYVYNVEEDELNAVKSLISNFKENQLHIAIISCYFPLHNILDQIPEILTYNPKSEGEKLIIDLQVKNFIEELEIQKTIRKVGIVSNTISKKVRNQYIENPYPKWRYSFFVQEKNRENLEKNLSSTLHSNFVNAELKSIDNPKILIAGCGTGQQVIGSSIYKNAQITAIDLSEKSLAYAKRKSIEYQMKNVKFIAMDLLDLDLLNEKYDIIECGGVLHHMQDPSQGLSVLCNSLSECGYLKLGLYSKTSRSIIKNAREKIKNLGFKSTPTGIRNFRKDVISGSIEELENLPYMFLDFYNLSTCRDLCFHECEHQFDIKSIKTLLKNNNLKFCGWNLPNYIKEDYLNDYPDDVEMCNLNNWKVFEQKNSKTFMNMYQFIVKRKND